MINSELIKRIINFSAKVSLADSENFLEKFLKKLKSETEIQDYKLLGKSLKRSLLTVDIKKDDWYRFYFYYDDVHNNLIIVDIINHSDTRDVFSSLVPIRHM